MGEVLSEYGVEWTAGAVELLRVEPDERGFGQRMITCSGWVTAACPLTICAPDEDEVEARGVLACGPTVSMGGRWLAQGQSLDQALFIAARIADHVGGRWSDRGAVEAGARAARVAADWEWADRARRAWEVDGAR